MLRNYADLYREARQQPEPQRFLFVFCRVELPEDASDAERKSFESGEGGALTPVVCVDKLPSDVPDFDGLVKESEATGQRWDMVFVAAMSGRAGFPPTADEARQPMSMMVEAVRMGSVGNFLAMNRAGEFVALD
ncbi:MAG: ribonucleotide reductase subunit alpha [Marinobacter sp.]|nr:ribonucleotide reductase subunit alpha [Marinobacter sp.]